MPILLAAVPTAAQPAALFVSRPGEVLRLVDLNADGDFLDFAEVTTYADGLSTGLGAIDGRPDRLFVLDADNETILILQDLNADGDALDFGEVAPYAELPPTQTPMPVGLTCHPDGTLLTADQTAGLLYRAADLNGDGDALDADELTLVATGLTVPTAVSARPDGRVLLAQQLPAVPVRILQDLNNNGDFLDFAENISYAQDTDPGLDVTAPHNQVSYLTRPATGTVIRLQDLNGDNDVLDFGEIVPYAEAITAPTLISHADTGNLYVATLDATGTLYHLHDLNGDGDALDFGEVLVVAENLGQLTGMAAIPAAPCIKGDLNGDGGVDPADLPLFVQVLLGTLTPPDPCPADMNGDGQTDAKDIPPFVDELVP